MRCESSVTLKNFSSTRCNILSVDNVTDGVTDDVTDDFTEDITDDVTNDVMGDVSDDVMGNVKDDVTDAVSRLNNDVFSEIIGLFIQCGQIW